MRKAPVAVALLWKLAGVRTVSALMLRSLQQSQLPTSHTAPSHMVWNWEKLMLQGGSKRPSAEQFRYMRLGMMVHCCRAAGSQSGRG